MHSHSDFTLPVYPTADSLVHQGITTAVVGQCGLSPAPLREKTRDMVVTYLYSYLDSFGIQSLPFEEWDHFGQYLAFLSKMGTSVNIVPLVGQGLIRAAVMGFASGQATPDQLIQMEKEVRQAVDEGAFGVSTGLIYPPGSYAAMNELICIVRPLTETGGIYFSHIRGEAATLLPAISEAIRIGQEAGAAVQISHFKAAHRNNWGKAGLALQLIDRARGDGFDITADMYPYTAGSTALVAVLPEWAQEGGKPDILNRLTHSKIRQDIVSSMKADGFAHELEWDKVMISGSPMNSDYKGKFISALSAESGKSPYEWIFDALVETDLNLSMVIFSMSEENLKFQLAHPAMMIGTDGTGLRLCGSSAKKAPHPRCFGTFPRILGHYVREEKIISLEDSIWKMTGLPAKKLGLKDRGFLRKGYQADLVLFDPARIGDRATYEEPNQYPTGMIHVMVNGRLVIHDGNHTGARPGMILRK
jgi:N-acyl-D-amino-acid deacylase